MALPVLLLRTGRELPGAARWALALVFAGVSLPSLAATSVKATVNGMVCAFCAQGIEKRLSALPATKAVFVDLKQKVVAVEAKDGQTIDVDKVRAEAAAHERDATDKARTQAQAAINRCCRMLAKPYPTKDWLHQRRWTKLSQY